jgi:diguanylate cyclase (GGDEF)-like protein
MRYSDRPHCGRLRGAIKNMSKLAGVIAGKLQRMLFCFVACVLAVAGVSIWSLSLSTSAADSLYHDKLRTLQATSSVSDGIRVADEQSLVILTTRDADARRTFIAGLLDTTVPNVEVQLEALRQLPSIDTASERVLVATLSAAWAALRDAIVPDIALVGTGNTALLARVDTRFAPIGAAVARLQAQEERESALAADHAHSAWTEGVLLIIIATAMALFAATTVVVRGARRFVERAVEGEAVQHEFAETMQLASTENDAYRVITRHIERVIPDGRAIILNRNNSADRLEAVTAMPSDWPLAHALEGARPRSCAAVRTTRSYRREPGAEPLLTCDVCRDCPRGSLCTPITVSGEIIGSVLVERFDAFDRDDEARIFQSVAQGAPVLANLRNLAIAELRASTDALTGLPNKRAVAYTLKRMVAQASRTVSPLAVLSLDLDNFKQINDQYGHPHGDEVLAAVGAVLQTATREADFAGRNGGEEFLVLLPATDLRGAHKLAETIASAIHEIYVHNVDRRITASIGIAVLPDDAGDAETLERAADRALYTAKNNGRDRIETAETSRPPSSGSRAAPIPSIDAAP